MKHWISRPLALAAVVAGAAVALAPAAATAKGPAPSVRWQSPVSGSQVATNLKGAKCRVAATGVDKVVFKLDGGRLGTDTKAPFTCSIATKKLHAGSYKVTATAYSSSGGESTATSVINVGPPANVVAAGNSSVGTARPVSLPTTPAPAPEAAAPVNATE